MTFCTRPTVDTNTFFCIVENRSSKIAVCILKPAFNYLFTVVVLICILQDTFRVASCTVFFYAYIMMEYSYFMVISLCDINIIFVVIK